MFIASWWIIPNHCSRPMPSADLLKQYGNFWRRTTGMTWLEMRASSWPLKVCSRLSKLEPRILRSAWWRATARLQCVNVINAIYRPLTTYVESRTFRDRVHRFWNWARKGSRYAAFLLSLPIRVMTRNAEAERKRSRLAATAAGQAAMAQRTGDQWTNLSKLIIMVIFESIMV